MNMGVRFTQSNQAFNTKMGGSDTTFGTDYGDLIPIRGKDGKSAYEIALDNGFEGTEEEWLASLHGKDGQEGTMTFEDLTDEQRAIIVDDVLEALPIYNGEVEEV